MSPPHMGLVTQAQAELPKWVVESGTGEVLHVPVGDAAEDVVIIPVGPRRTVNPLDFRELIAQGLVRHVKGQGA